MRRALVALVVASWATVAQAGVVSDFGDILFWAGSGTNQAAFVLDFGTSAPQGSPPAVAWGYRWNGSANLADMIFSLAGTITGSGAPAAVAGSDPRLGVDVLFSPDFNGPGLNEYFVTSLSYDQVGLPAGWSQDVRSLVNDYDNDLGVAQYGNPGSGGSWPSGGMLGISSFGPVSTPLAAGGWYGYVVAQYDPLNDYAYPDPFAFSQPTAAVPEPAALLLAAVGVVVAGLGQGLRRRFVRATLGRSVSRPPHPRNPS